MTPCNNAICSATHTTPGFIMEALYEGRICYTVASRDFLVVVGLEDNQDNRNMFDSLYDDYIEMRG